MLSLLKLESRHVFLSLPRRGCRPGSPTPSWPAGAATPPSSSGTARRPAAGCILAGTVLKQSQNASDQVSHNGPLGCGVRVQGEDPSNGDDGDCRPPRARCRRIHSPHWMYVFCGMAVSNWDTAEPQLLQNVLTMSIPESPGLVKVLVGPDWVNRPVGTLKVTLKLQGRVGGPGE